MNQDYHKKVNNIYLFIDVANFMNVDGKIDDANDLYSYDARNPLTTFVFET